MSCAPRIRSRPVLHCLHCVGIPASLLLGHTAAQTFDAAPSSASIVASIELAAPAAARFPLEATLPVPPGTWSEGSVNGSFFLRQDDGQNVLAQVEVVSRYADAKQGADVVQLIASVERPADAAIGDTLDYDVLWLPFEPSKGVLPYAHEPADAIPIALAQAVDDFLTNSHGLLVRARDVHDNVYVGLLDFHDAFAADATWTQGKLLRNGHAVLQARLHTILRPALPGSVANSFLPHLFSVHAYLSAYANSRVMSLDLRIANGGSGADELDPLDDPLGKEYFKDIELLLPSGWTAQAAVHDPFLGAAHDELGGWTALPLVAPIATGAMHVMPSQAQVQRRLVIVPKDPSQHELLTAQTLLAHGNLGFCRPGADPQADALWSWWNPQTARYFPQRHALPRLAHLSTSALRAQQQVEFETLLQHVESGTSYGGLPVPSAGLGWAHPWGVAYGGMTGGEEIVFWDGIETAWTASAHGYRTFELVHRMQSDRHPTALYDRDGEPTRLEHWVQSGPYGPYVDMYFYLTLTGGGGDPFGFDEAPTFQEEFVHAQHLEPAWENELLAYEPHDPQHLVRYLRAAEVLAWLGNDALAKDDLCMQAELVRLSYHGYANSMYGQVMSTGLLADQLAVAAHPNHGFDIGRGEGWMFQALACAYALATPGWRASVRPLLDDIVDLVRAGQQSCEGTFQAATSSKFLDGKYQTSQAIEHAVLVNALWSLHETVYRDADALRSAELTSILSDATWSMAEFPSWSDALAGPYGQVAVAPLDFALPPFCGALPADGVTDWIETYQTPSCYAYGYDLTHVPLFVQRAEQMLGAPLLPTLEQAGLTNLGNLAALLRVAQDLAH